MSVDATFVICEMMQHQPTNQMRFQKVNAECAFVCGRKINNQSILKQMFLIAREMLRCKMVFESVPGYWPTTRHRSHIINLGGVIYFWRRSLLWLSESTQRIFLPRIIFIYALCCVPPLFIM